MQYAFAIPILPGKTEAAREWLQTVLGPKSDGWSDLQNRQGVTEEYYFLQESPEGDMVIICGNGQWVAPGDILDPENNAFDAWLREKVMEINGIDVLEFGGQAPEKLGEWHVHVTSDAPAAG